MRPDLAGAGSGQTGSAGSGQTGSAGVYKAGQRESGAVKAVGQESGSRARVVVVAVGESSAGLSGSRARVGYLGGLYETVDGRDS